MRLGRGLVEALEAIHAVGVVHRDLKPGNVLLEDGEPVVIDFGIAHIADDVRLTSSGLVMGTPGYLSPEVIGGSPVTQATDWWGWAATLAFAASGRPPFGRGPDGRRPRPGQPRRDRPHRGRRPAQPAARRRAVAGPGPPPADRRGGRGPRAVCVGRPGRAPLRGPAPWTSGVGRPAGNPAWANPTGPGAYGTDVGPHPEAVRLDLGAARGPGRGRGVGRERRRPGAVRLAGRLGRRPRRARPADQPSEAGPARSSRSPRRSPPRPLSGPASRCSWPWCGAGWRDSATAR